MEVKTYLAVFSNSVLDIIITCCQHAVVQKSIDVQ